MWVIRFGGSEWRESDLTLGMAVLFQELSGKPWPTLPVASALELVSLLAVLIADGDPKRLDDALAQASALNMAEALDMVSPEEG